MTANFRFTLRIKILLLMILLSFLLTVLIGIIVINTSKTALSEEIALNKIRLKNQLIDKGKAIAANIALISVNAIAEYNFSLLEELINATTQDQEVLYAAFISQTGEIMAASKAFQPESATAENQQPPSAEKPDDISVREFQRGQQQGIEIRVRLNNQGEQLGVFRLGITLEFFDQEIRNSERQMTEKVAAIWTRLWLTMLGCLVVSSLIAFIASRRLTTPIRRLVASADAVSQGDLSYQVAITSHDEIGDLARSFTNMLQSLNDTARLSVAIAKGDLSSEILPKSEHDTLKLVLKEMSQYLKEMAVIATRISAGDLTVNITPRSEQDTLGLAFHAMVENLSALIADIREGAAQVAKEAQATMATAEQMAHLTMETQAQAHEVSMAAKTTGENITAIAGAISEMTAAMAEIAKHTGETRNVAQRANNEAKITRKAILDLTESSGKISEITKLIGTIASQTNLLALNATIEASRAGDAGKGFAVVAAEVKELSRETGRAVTEIDDIVTTLHDMASSAKHAMERIVTVIEQMMEFSDIVVAAVDEQTIITGEINHSTQQANEQVGQMFSMNETIADAGKHIAQEAERVRSSAVAFTELSETLYALSQTFNIR